MSREIEGASDEDVRGVFGLGAGERVFVGFGLGVWRAV